MSEDFEVTYSNDDDYAGSSGRLHSFDIDADELDGSMDDEQLKAFFWERIEEHFRNNKIHLYSQDEEGFISWAKEQIAEMQKEAE